MLKPTLLLTFFAYISCERSFTLVLDTTNSMEAEILIVRANIWHVLGRNLTTYSNFVLVPFKDTVPGQIFTTPSVEEYISHINSLSTAGGGDCPENSLAGIKAALRASARQSTIFVFTDGFANDYNEFSAVESLCKETNSQVIIFLSGHCNPSRDRFVGSVEVYHDIAKVCSGAMLKWDSLVDLREAFKFMKEVITTDWTNVTYEKFVNNKELSFEVDRFTTDLMMVVTGSLPVVEIEGSSSQRPKIENIVKTRQPLVIRITPEIGDYTASIRGQGLLSVSFYERRHVPFEFGFSTKSPRTIRETSARPIAGTTNYILLSVDDSIRLRSVEWLKLGENTKRIVLLQRIPSGCYVASLHVEQGKTFRFWIVGEDSSSQREIKGSSNVFTSQLQVDENDVVWMKPESEILDNELGLVDYRSELILAAKVIGFPRPDIRWKNEDDEILASETVLVEIPSVFVSYVTIPNVSKNSTITCLARNDEGDSERSIDVYVNRTLTFDVIQSPEDASVEFGTEYHLNCEIDAYPEATLSWYLNGTQIDAACSRLSVEATAVVIKNMGFEDIGAYECRVSNGVQSKTLTAKIELTGVEVPEIDATETEKRFKPSDLQAKIKCRITKGKPTPIISWQYKSAQDTEFAALPYDVSNSVSDTVLIDKVDRRHAGVYRCIAANVMGDDTQDFDVQILSPPVIKNSEPESRSVKEGQEVRLPCEVEATPRAAVRWEVTKDDVMVTLDRHHWTDNTHTHRFRAHPNDSGNYHCIAENIVGKAEKTVVVNVLESPYIQSEPEGMYVKAGERVVLPCNVVRGNPAPVVRWEYRPRDSLTFSRLSRNNPSNAVQLEAVSKIHEGWYRCIAENQLGTDSIKYHVVVL